MGHLYFHDFWQQHNEHRLFFPTLVLVGFAYITHWNIQIECFLSLLVATTSFIMLNKVITKDLKSKIKSGSLLLFLLTLIWFSPVQVENWLWGWQIEWFMNVLGVIMVAFGIALIKDRYVPLINLALILLGGLLAQYSLGNGTLIWPIVIATLIYIRVTVIKIVLAVATGVCSTLLYYYHYVNPAEPSITLAVHEPIMFTEYVLGYLGRPLSFLHKPAMALGFVLLSVFVAFIVYLFVRQKTIFRNSLPWVILGLYAISSALVTGFARLGLGVSEAYSSRYTTVSSLLLVAVIMLCWSNRKALQGLLGNVHKLTMPLMALGIFCLVGIEWGWGIHSAYEQHIKRETIKSCTSAKQPTDNCLALTYPNPATVKPRLQYIKSIHWGGY
jgi:hypothetical protein